MSRLEKVKDICGNVADVFGKAFDKFMTSLIESYGWRGFLFRAIFVPIIYMFGVAGAPENNIGTAGGKLMVASGLLLIYAVGKLIYDYTKVGKESEAKKRNKVEGRQE